MPEIEKNQKSPDYFEIIKKSWKISWKNKKLWWFGLFVFLGGGFNFSFLFDEEKFLGKYETSPIVSGNFPVFIEQYFIWIVIGAFFLLVLCGIFFVLNIFGRIGLIDSIDGIEKNKSVSFRGGMRSGKIFFWKIFFIRLTIGMFMLGVTLVLFFPVGYLLYLKSALPAFLSLFLAVIIWIALIILAFFVRIYGVLYAVLGKISVKESLENAYAAFGKNIAPSIFMFLIIAAIVVVFSILLFIFLGGLLFVLVSGIKLPGAAVLIGAVLSFLVLLIGSIKETFFQAVWFLFFKEIAIIGNEEKIIETESKSVLKNISDPEGISAEKLDA